MTNEQKQLLKHFRDLSGLPLRECKQLLLDYNWDIDKAKQASIDNWLNVTMSLMDKDRYY